MRKTILLVMILLLPAIAGAEPEKKTDVWEPLRFLEGSWGGTGDGLSGQSEVTVTFEFILGDRFLQTQTKSVFEPQEKNPKGEVHEDMAIFSYDRGRGTFVLRAFYVEGFVNTYVLSETSEDGQTLIFETEAVENAPDGTRARLIFQRTGKKEMEQKFFVAFPGQELSCYSTNRLKKR